MGTQIRVQTEDFDLAREYQAQRERLEPAGACGAIACFAGLVRDQYQGEAVGELFLEHYPGMTEASIEALVAKAAARWELLDVLVIHRVGALLPTDQIVLVSVASPHRAEAFAACEFVMDYLKTDAVFWKREVLGERGAHWVESTAADRARVAGWQTQGSGADKQ